MSGKHTKTPWIAVDGDMREIEITTQHRIDNSRSPICEMDLDYIGEMGDEQRANVEFIVRACNAHDDLLEALLLIDPTGKFDKWQNGDGEEIGPTIAAAIRKATGEKP